MKRNIFRILLSAVLTMCCTFSASAQLGTPPDDEIWYTTTDGQVCDPNGFSYGYHYPFTPDFGATIISNTYPENGHGTIKFDGAVTTIGQDAFMKLPRLTSMSIPCSVRSIGEHAFFLCENLTSVSIPNGVTYIGPYALNSCYRLVSVTIPGSVTSIGRCVFTNSNNLSEVFFCANCNMGTGEDSPFYLTNATIYVADSINFSSIWHDRPAHSWRSGKGDGTAESPFEIENYRNLYGFSLEVQQGNTNICGKLTADITMNNNVLNEDGTLRTGTFETWTPIGTYDNAFAGTFDGNGHTISGLYVINANHKHAALFGRTLTTAYIHDLGVKDSYFSGNNWVAGICGDFASGRIENCWNGATVICNGDNSCAGGIAGSCWIDASVNGCYNIGMISVESGSNSQCGGICGTVAKNNDPTVYSVSNCVTLEGKCSVEYNLYDDANIHNVLIKDAEEFADGEACWILNGNQRSTTWRQLLGTDNYPMVTGDYLIYYDDGEREYLNETMCDHTTDHLHTFELKTMTQGGSTIQYWHCTSCGKDYQYYNRMNELPGTECTEPSAGDGSQANPYQIATLENLMWFADHVNSGNTTANAILTADITMNANVLNRYGNLNSVNFVAWIPIGGHGVDYSGEFNGNGHTISGLYFKNTDMNNVGLFGKLVGNAHIHDLGIKDSYFYGQDHVGGICGDFASGKIENCWNGAYVMAHEYDAGGISGSCYFNASIANCYNIGIVSTYEEKVGAQGVTKNEKFGGICGSVYNNSATYSIDNCYTLKSRAIPEGGDPYEGLPHVSYDCDKIYGFLAEGCPESKIHDSYVMKAEAFAGGEVCYRLNHGVTDGTQKWFQTLGSDLSPVMDNSHNTVYYGYDGDVLKYSNSPISVGATHRDVCAATCNSVGYTMECWEDTRSGRVFADEACATELNAAYVTTYSPVMTTPEYSSSIAGWPWSMKDDVTYDGVTFINPLEKVYSENSSYISSEYVWFKVKDATAMNVRLKWHLNKNTFNGELYYKINDGDETKIDIPENMWVQNLPDLKQDDIVTVYYKITGMWSFPLTWTMSLEYCPGHSIEHVDAMAATCTVKGNYENWYCKKCDKHFANAECTTVMNDWEIPALDHNATHHEPKAATCTEDGNIDHWHCSNCNLNYREQACTSQITDDVVLPKLNHKNKEHQARVEATCLTDGNIEYWHCPDCSTYFTNEACTASTTDYIIAALGHDFTYTPYRTSTCTSEGDVEHWHCNRCEKDFNTGEEMASEDHVISGSLIIPCKESDALVVGLDEGKTYDDCHTFTPPTEEGETTIATVTLGEGVISMKIKNGEKTAYSLNETKPLETFFAHTFTLKANKDPEHTENYYSTFFTNEYAYKVPTMAKAYEGDVESGDDADVLKLSSVGGVIPQGEAVILKATDSSIELLPSARRPEASSENDLEGTDKEKTLGANQYALSLGQEGVGFYLWEGKSIGANKAYLTLNASAGAKAFIFQFDDDPTGIEEASPISSPEGKDLMYDLNGVRVNESYKGIVIKNGKKVYRK